MEADFGGYATKAGLKCTDGRVITPEAFRHMNGKQVPLVWAHGHDKPENVLGHAVLEVREDGVYAYGYFNDTPSGINSRKMVLHKDINALSIYANGLVEKAIKGTKSVLHGMIREVSLVMAGANPGALIDFVRVAHADGDVETLEDEAVIYSGVTLEHVADDEEYEEEEEDDTIEHADDDTVQDIYDSMTPEQKNVLHYLVGAALENAGAAHSDTNGGDLEHDTEGTGEMARNVFEQNDKGKTTTDGVIRHTVTGEDMKGIVADAVKSGSLKDAVEAYAFKHGIENLELLFPDARTLQDRPEFNKRRTEWVAGVLNMVRHSPFSRVKTVVADITQDEARARGYIKGRYKVEEWFGLTKRTTSPTTVYKKQKLDRDDIIDITDFDAVVWLKQEMRMMLEEELARAILIGDGRDVASEDKIKDPIGAADGVGIRSIANDHELFVTQVNVNVDDANSSYEEVVDAVMDAMEHYKGTGTPDFYTTIRTLNRFLKAKDGMGRRLYKDKNDVAAALGVNSIITVEPMNDHTDIVGIIVNLADYNVGADRGGEVSLFDDFDIDYNQYKYLIETRLSGALTKIKSALVIRKTLVTNVLVDPNEPTFNATTGVITIPTQTGVVYKNAVSGATLTAGAQTALTPGSSLSVRAEPASGYFFRDTVVDGPWPFKRPAA